MSRRCPRTGKIIYPTERAATIALEDLQAQGREEQSFYPCGSCNGYHLSHYPEGYYIEHEQWNEGSG